MCQYGDAVHKIHNDFNHFYIPMSYSNDRHHMHSNGPVSDTNSNLYEKKRKVPSEAMTSVIVLIVIWCVWMSYHYVMRVRLIASCEDQCQCKLEGESPFHVTKTISFSIIISISRELHSYNTITSAKIMLLIGNILLLHRDYYQCKGYEN